MVNDNDSASKKCFYYEAILNDLRKEELEILSSQRKEQVKQIVEQHHDWELDKLQTLNQRLIKFNIQGLY